MDKFVIVQRKRKRSSSRERDFCKRDRNSVATARVFSPDLRFFCFIWGSGVFI